ncbi:MAG: DUF302 domain-containing protein [Betaproteobacteria bacterium]|nr:DUF302 domain-containing protein [Betaproteobacteria bacterium]
MRKCFALLSALLFSLAAHAGGDYLVVKTKQGRFEDVRDDLVNAIESRGIKINHFNHIADMLERTGKDLGATKRVYVKGEQVEFCKSDLSRAQMEADPGNMVFCPYIISVYTTPADPARVHVAYRRPLAPGAGEATRQALRNIDKLLAEIVAEAVQ